MNISNNYSNRFQKSGVQSCQMSKSIPNTHFGAIERTLLVIKPDAFKEPPLAGAIMGFLHINGDGLKIVKSGTKNHAPTEGLVIEGENAVSRLQELASRFKRLFPNGEGNDAYLETSKTPELVESEIKGFFSDIPLEKTNKERIPLTFARFES